METNMILVLPHDLILNEDLAADEETRTMMMVMMMAMMMK